MTVPEDHNNSIWCYWLDTCPVCGKPCTNGCRCPINHRWCDDGHRWIRNKDGTAVIEIDEEAAKVRREKMKK